MPPEKIGRYEIKSELGRGGMASVYLAFDPRFKREVAIKILPPQLLVDPVYRTRFEREAQTIAALEHPAIVPVYDFGEEDGQLYLVMRSMPGGSLADKLKTGTIPPVEVVHIITRIASALDQVHARGIIHRDLKPGNILFDQYGEAHLSDFGIARLAEATTTLTGTSILGTPAYMSPEQARGDMDIDKRSDLYAVGAILFQMLSGKLPFESTTPMGVAMKHITDPVPSLVKVRPDLSPSFDLVIETAMAKDRTKRYQSGQELAKAIDDATAGRLPPRPTAIPQESFSSSRTSTPSPAEVNTSSRLTPAPKARVSWFFFAGGGILLLLICAAAVIGIGWAAGLWGKAEPAVPSPIPAQVEDQLPYFDDFSNPASGWQSGSNSYGQSGYHSDGDGNVSYQILVNAPNQHITARPKKYFSDVAIEFDATQLDGPQDAYYGALCRFQDNANYYYLIIGSDGFFNIGKVTNTVKVSLSNDLDFSSAIQPIRVVNSLRAECTSDILALYANGELLAQVQDGDLTSGDVGLLAGTLDTPGADIHFSNFYVTLP